MKTMIVTATELRVAAERWYKLHGLKSISMWHYLKYLGEEEQAEKLKAATWGRATWDIEVSEESARKIKALNGPHYKTLLAMYKAQNMIE